MGVDAGAGRRQGLVGSVVGSLVGSVVGALRPGPAPWAVAAAVRTVLAAGAVAVLAATAGDADALSVAYLGAACSVAFVPRGTYRVQAVGLAAQAAGAVIGITAGALGPHSTAGLVVVAALAGLVSGATGGLGPRAPGFGIMLGIGVAFAQFDGSSLPWFQQVEWYLVGTAVIAAATLVPWAWRRGTPEREAVAEVFAAAADLAELIGTPKALAARARLAAASARARDATRHVQAELVAFTVAARYARGRPLPAAAVGAVRAAGEQVRHGLPIGGASPPDPHPDGDPDRDPDGDPDGDPDLRALADALSARPTRPVAPPRARLRGVLRALTEPPAPANAIRVGLCLAAATALTATLHEPDHSFWLPLSVAVIVRPEYASVFVRTVNRVAGTVVGAAAAAAVLAVAGHGLPVAVVAAVALGGAVLSAPKLYAYSVVGVTASALLAASIARPDPVLPALRLLDTLLGAALAIVLGYLLWPGARRLPTTARLDRAVVAARRYLSAASEPPPRRSDWPATRDEAYRLVHRARGAAEAALLEPPPVGPLAVRAVAAAARLEDTVDAITAVAAVVDDGARPTELIGSVERDLDELGPPTGG